MARRADEREHPGGDGVDERLYGAYNGACRHQGHISRIGRREGVRIQRGGAPRRVVYRAQMFVAVDTAQLLARSRARLLHGPTARRPPLGHILHDGRTVHTFRMTWRGNVVGKSARGEEQEGH
jgi:hypothetical protein